MEPDVFGMAKGRDWFFYIADVAAISTAVPNVATPLQIDADSDFYWVATSYQADIAAATLTEATNVVPLVRLQMQDTGTGRFFQNAPMALGAIAGDGKRPYRLPRPRRFGKNATININWTNAVAAGTTYRIQLVLHGYKIYT